MDHQQLVRLVKEKKINESVELAKFIDKNMKTSATKFNYALCLENNGQLEENIKVLEELYKQDVEEDKYYSYYIVETGLLDFNAEVSKELVGGHLLVSHWKMDNKERLQEILEERKSFVMIPSEEMMPSLVRILNSNLIQSNYTLICEKWRFKLVLGGDSKRTEFKENSFVDLSIPLPNELQELYLERAQLKCEKDTNRDWLPKKLNKLEIINILQQRIILSLESISSIENISLNDCSLSLDSVHQISTIELKLEDVSFVKNGEELSNIKVTEFIDFHKMNKLELICDNKKNVSIDLSKEIATMEYLHLEGVTVFSLKSTNGRVNIKEAEIWGCSLDLSILPPSLEKLTIRETSNYEVFLSRGINFPNLKYLESDDSSSLPYFRSLQLLTSVNLIWVEEINVDFLPPSAKIIQIYFRTFTPIGTKFTGGVMQLNTLVLEDFPLGELDHVLPHFQKLQQLVIYSDYETPYHPIALTQLPHNQVPAIAIGWIEWIGCDSEQVLNISKLVDRQWEYYVFQGGTGKAIEQNHFFELYKKF